MITAHSQLVLGGARSGKTRFAMECATEKSKRIYLATAEAWDDEMRERIHRHQQERDSTWTTIEEPRELGPAIRRIEQPDTAIVVDCLTLWLNNLMAAECDIDRATEEMLAAAAASHCKIIFVSNEVGLGIVPESALARRFRDAQGRLNQRVAATVERVDFVAAGLPLNLKPGPSS